MNLKFILKYSAIALIANFILFISSCSGIKVEQDVKISPEDWLMAGGSPEQTNISPHSLAPPLYLMWDFNIEGGVGPSGIAVADAVVFVNALQGELFTFDVSTGGKIGGIKFLGKDASTSPLVLGNNVILAYAGDNKYSLASYDISKGLINWRKNFGYIQSSPILKDNNVFFGGLNGNFYKTDAASGRRLWKFDSKSPVHSTCAVSGENVIFGNDKGIIFCLNISDGSQKWKIETGGPVLSAPMIEADEGICYIGGDDSNYYAIKIADGSVLWKNNLKTKIISGSALYNNESVIVTCVDGSVYSLDKATGNIKWKYSTDGAIVSAPVVSGSYIYFSSYDSYVYSLDAVTGNMVWKWELENKVKTSPVVWKEFLFVAADDIVYCFTNKPVVKTENKN